VKAWLPRDSESPQKAATTYSPLFVRCYAKNHKLRITARGIKKRHTARFEDAHKKSTLNLRKPLATMAQGLSPGQLPDQPPAVKQDEEWRENLNFKMICKECKEDPPELVEDHASGDMICGSCGLVLQERSIDQSSEWRTFSNDDQGTDDPSRVGDGPNALLNGAQLNTGIAFGEGLKSKELHRAQNKANIDKGNKSLLQAYKQIGALCDGWQLPNSVSDTAKHIFKDADESKNFRGKSQEALIAGCVFLACRRNNVPRSFREVMELTKVSKKEIGRVFKTLENFLMNREKSKGDTSIVGGGKSCESLSIDDMRSILNMCSQGIVVQNEAYTGSGSADPGDLCNRFCSMLDMDQKTTNVATGLAFKMKNTGALAGRSPLSSAAACIFMAGHLMGAPKNAKEIMAVARVSDSTIRQAYKLLYAEKDQLVTEEFINRGARLDRLPKPA